MICLHAFRMPAREDEEAFFSDPRNQRICYTAKEPFHVFRCCHLPQHPPPHSPRGPDQHQRRRWTMCGSAGRSFGSGRQTSAPPENAPQSGRKVFWTAGQRNFFWRRCHAVSRHL